MTRSAPSLQPMETNMYPGYPFYGYPPPVYGPPNNVRQPDLSDLERGMKIAMRISEKRENKEAKKKKLEAKAKAENIKKTVEDRRKTFLSIEWFILGLMAYPLVGPLYWFLTHWRP